MIPGEFLVNEGEIELNAGRETVELTVANSGDRPVQVGSHAHFFEVNKALRFEREKAYGFRLDVPAGTALRFEPGEEKRITLVRLAGARNALGLNTLVDGNLEAKRETALRRAAEAGYLEDGGVA
jgi:urease beta subunit